jgi:pimeloyl-ACP methyl ester carboxylesterase
MQHRRTVAVAVLIACILLSLGSCRSPVTMELSGLPDGVAVAPLKSYGRLQFWAMRTLAGLDVKDIEFRYRVDLYRVYYPSMTPRGESGSTTGLLVIPRGIDEYRGLVSWQHGTTPVADGLPSVPDLYQGMFPALLFSMGGYVTVAPDYYGYDIGEPAYLDALSQGQSVVNLISAARTVLGAQGRRAGSLDQVFLVGFSQGGHATFNAIEQWRPEYGRIAAAASLSGPAAFAEPLDICEEPLSFENALYGEDGSHTLYLSFVSRSYASWYGHDLSQFIRSPYTDAVETLFDGRHSYDEIDEWIDSGDVDGSMIHAEELFSSEFHSQFAEWQEGRAEPPWLVARLRENAAVASQVTFPFRIYGGTLDRDVPLTEASFAAERLWAGQAELIVLENAAHDDVAFTGLPDVRRWFDQLTAQSSGPDERSSR